MTPHDPERLAETLSWIRRADRDLHAARGVLTLDPPLTDDSAFHCQQAVEKLLKAFLTWHDQPFRRTHDLGALGYQCSQIDASLENLLREAAPLTEYAWKFRYPIDEPEPESSDVQYAIQLAERVRLEILYRLPEEITE